MDRERMEARVGELLALRDKLGRLHLSLPPNLRMELVSLENRLGWSTMVPMSRRRYAKARLPQRNYAEFINHAGHALDNPLDNTAVLSMADHLHDNHPGDPHAEAFIDWANGTKSWNEIAPQFQHAVVKPTSHMSNYNHEAGGPYIHLTPSKPRGYPGERPPESFYSLLQDRDVVAAGRLAKRVNTPYWEMVRPTANVRWLPHPSGNGSFRRSVSDPKVRMTGADVAQHLYDADGLRSLLLAVVGARHFHPDKPLNPDGTGVRFSRSRPRRYSEQQDEDSFHAALDANPDDHTTRLVFADWLQERGDPRAEGYRALGVMGVRPDSYHGGSLGVRHYYLQNQPHARDAKSVLGREWLGAIPNREGTPTARYFNDRRSAEDAAAHAFTRLPPERRAELLNPHKLRRRRPNYRFARLTLGAPRPFRGPGGEAMHEHDYHDESGAKLGVVRIHPRDDGRHLHVQWVGPTTAEPGARTGEEGVEGVHSLRDQLPRHYPDAEFVSGVRASGPKKGQRVVLPIRKGRRGVVRYAKAEKDRHPAHPLIAGFPLEHALRHLANDPNANDTLRGTAKHVLTTGDTSGLWALHDLVQQHENPDGTSGHPILKAGYNFMSAADKVQLDKHTHRALTEAAEHERRNTPGPHHTEGTTNLIHDYTPEYMAGRLARGFGSRAMTPQELRDRVHNRVKELQPGTEDDAIGDSVDRHAYRHAMEFYKRNGIRHDAAERAIVNPKNNPHKEGGTARQETKTRYRRRFVVAKYAAKPVMGMIDGLVHVGSKNHGAIVDAARNVAKRMGIHDTHVLPALHIGPGGAFPGVAQAVYGQVAPEKVHELAAWVNGLLPPKQEPTPGYAVHHIRPNGPDTLYRFRQEGSRADIVAKLKRLGITELNLLPIGKGADIMIPDKGNKLGKNVDEYARIHGLQMEASPGHFQTVGGSDQAASRATFRNKVVAGERTNMGRTNPRRYALPHSTNPDDIGGVSGERRNQLVHPGTFVGGPVRMEPRTGGEWDHDNLVRAGLLASRRPSTANYQQDTIAGGKLADILDESSQPHAPFFRNLTASGSGIDHRGMDGVSYREFQNDPHPVRQQVIDGQEPIWWFSPGDKGTTIVHRRPFTPSDKGLAGTYTTSHTAVLRAPALREWATHPMVSQVLKKHLLAAAKHLESHAPPAPPPAHPDEIDHNARMSRRRRLLCPS